LPLEQIAILGIGTAVPAHVLEQQDVSMRLQEALRERSTDARWVQRIFAHCGVETRYTCEPNLLEPAEHCRYLPLSPVSSIPSTEERMALYREESVQIAIEAARKALADGRIRSGEITHLLAVSCTGMFLPGLDSELTSRLDLPADVRRIPLTFLGCAAGLTALRMAEEIVRNDDHARILVVAVELCSLHIQPSFEREHLFTASFFGDGASACVVGKAGEEIRQGFILHKAQASFLPNSSDKMSWTVGNYGFRLKLSPDIPRLIASEVPEAFRSFWGSEGMPELWAIHPGGRGIIDSLASSFRLTESQTEPSRAILRRYGNMSSATILFVFLFLRDELRRTRSGEKTGSALAFGPGMTAEMIRFSYRP